MPVRLIANPFGQQYDIPIKMIRFAGGELQPRIEQIPFGAPDPGGVGYVAGPINGLRLRVDFRSSDDLVAMLLLADAVRRHPYLRDLPLHLQIPYFPGARQDRVCYPGEPLTATVMARIVNAEGFHTVEVWDPHSDVVPALLDRCIIVPAAAWATCRQLPTHPVVVAPDRGAEKRANQFGWAHGAMYVAQADKHRDPMNGKITAISFNADDIGALRGYGDADFLMVDDISDGGGTFLQLAQLLRAHTTGKVNLFVTHLIGAGGFDKFRGVIDQIYTPNSFSAAPHDLVTVLSQS